MLSTVHRLGTEVYLKRKKVLIDAQLLKIYKKTKNYSDTKSFNNTDTLDAALKHTLLQGGKRIRPILAIATYELYGSDPNAIMGPACALELIHTGSLMLDDLPSMDNAQYRRGVKTSHSQYWALSILGKSSNINDPVCISSRAQAGPIIALGSLPYSS